MRHLFILLIFSFPLFANAQYPPMTQRWGVTFSPAIIATPLYEYGIQPGIEYRLSPRFYLLAEPTFITGNDNKDKSAINRKYFRFRTELKYMLPHGSRRFHEYLAVQLSYACRRFTHLDGIYFNGHTIDTVAIAFTRANVKSPVSALALLYVFDFYPFKKIYVETFAGLGIREVNTHYFNVENPQVVPYQTPKDRIFLTPDDADQFNAGIYRFHLSAGIRLLYRFNNR
jgi:hypothetical protein